MIVSWQAMKVINFNIRGRVWRDSDSYQIYSESLKIEAPTTSKAFKKVQARLFEKFGSDSALFRARFRIDSEEAVYEMMGFGARFDLEADEIEKLKNDIVAERLVSVGLRKLIARYPWITKTDLAIAFKGAFPSLSSEVSQLIWNWRAGASSGIEDSELDKRIDNHLRSKGYN